MKVVIHDANVMYIIRLLDYVLHCKRCNMFPNANPFDANPLPDPEKIAKWQCLKPASGLAKWQQAIRKGNKYVHHRNCDNCLTCSILTKRPNQRPKQKPLMAHDWAMAFADCFNWKQGKWQCLKPVFYWPTTQHDPEIREYWCSNDGVSIEQKFFVLVDDFVCHFLGWTLGISQKTPLSDAFSASST